MSATSPLLALLRVFVVLSLMLVACNAMNKEIGQKISGENGGLRHNSVKSTKPHLKNRFFKTAVGKVIKELNAMSAFKNLAETSSGGLVPISKKVRMDDGISAIQVLNEARKKKQLSELKLVEVVTARLQDVSDGQMTEVCVKAKLKGADYEIKIAYTEAGKLDTVTPPSFVTSETVDAVDSNYVCQRIPLEKSAVLQKEGKDKDQHLARFRASTAKAKKNKAWTGFEPISADFDARNLHNGACRQHINDNVGHQGDCGCCYAFAATGVAGDRQCLYDAKKGSVVTYQSKPGLFVRVCWY